MQHVIDNEKAKRKTVKHIKKRALSDREKVAARMCFDRFDKDKSGTIDARELQSIIGELLEVKLTPDEFDSLTADVIKRGDKDGDGVIEFAEFANFYSKCLANEELRHGYVEKLEKRYGRAMGLTDDELMG